MLLSLPFHVLKLITRFLSPKSRLKFAFLHSELLPHLKDTPIALDSVLGQRWVEWATFVTNVNLSNYFCVSQFATSVKCITFIHSMTPEDMKMHFSTFPNIANIDIDAQITFPPSFLFRDTPFIDYSVLQRFTGGDYDMDSGTPPPNKDPKIIMNYPKQPRKAREPKHCKRPLQKLIRGRRM